MTSRRLRRVTSTLRAVLAATAFIAPLLAASPALACQSDAECKGDRVCEAGLCVPPRTAAPRAAPAGVATPAVAPVTPPSAPLAAPSTTSAPGASATRSVFVNSLGLFQFGLSPSIEFGERGAFSIRTLLVNTGLLSYAATNGDTLHFSWGAGVGYRHYLGTEGNLRGPYLGATALYLSWEQQYQEDVLYKTTRLAIMSDFGYRWVYSNGFTLGVGAMLGGAPVLSATAEPLSYGNAGATNHAENMVVGFLVVDVGFLL